MTTIFKTLFANREPTRAQLLDLCGRLDGRIESVQSDIRRLEDRIPGLMVQAQGLDGGNNERVRAQRMRRDLQELQNTRKRAGTELEQAERREQQVARDQEWQRAQEQGARVREAAEAVQQAVEQLYTAEAGLRDAAVEFVRSVPSLSASGRLSMLTDFAPSTWINDALICLRMPGDGPSVNLTKLRRDRVDNAVSQWTEVALRRPNQGVIDDGRSEARPTE